MNRKSLRLTNAGRNKLEQRIKEDFSGELPSYRQLHIYTGLDDKTIKKICEGQECVSLSSIEKFFDKFHLDIDDQQDYESCQNKPRPPQSSSLTNPSPPGNRPQHGQESCQSKPLPSPSSSPLNLAPPSNRPRHSQYFVGRDEELNSLHEQLQTSCRGAITGIVGMGGIGKTELALQYSESYEAAYPGGICWIKACKQDIGSQIVNFARSLLKLTPPSNISQEDQVAYCWYNWPVFSSENGSLAPVLVVLDDVNHYQEIEPYLPIQESFILLITTRINLGAPVKPFPIKVLGEAASLEFLRKLAGCPKRIDEQLLLAKALCQWLGYLPLALELVGRYLGNKPDCSIETLQERLNEKELQAKALIKREEGMTATLGVASAFELSWKELSETAQHLAMSLSLFAPADILWKWVEKCWPDYDQEKLEDLRDEELIRLSLIQWKKNNTYQLHALIHLFIRAKLDQSEQRKEFISVFCDSMVTTLQKMPQHLMYCEIETWQVIIPHIAEIAYQWTEGVKDKDLLPLLQSLANFYTGPKNYKASESLHLLYLQVLRKRFGNKHADVATCLNSLADLYSVQGQYKKAEYLLQTALDIRKQLFGDMHRTVADSLHSQASLYFRQGHYKRAESSFWEALIMRKELLGHQHLDVSKTFNNLAMSYAIQGSYDEAESFLKEAIKIQKYFLNGENPILVGTLHNLGSLYKKKGEFDKAKKLLTDALELREKLFGNEHPDFAQSLDSLAELDSSQENYSDAEKKLNEALNIYKHIFGDVHRTVANSFYKLATLYDKQDCKNEAISYFEKSLITYGQLLSDSYPNVTQLKNLMDQCINQAFSNDSELFLCQMLKLFESTLRGNHLLNQTFKEYLQVCQKQFSSP